MAQDAIAGSSNILHLISQETLHPSLSSSETRGSEQTKRCVYAVCFLLSSSEPPAWQVLHNELQHMRKDAVISWHWLRYSVFTDGLTAPVPSPRSNKKNQAALHAQTATTCKTTPPCKEQNTPMCG